ncbi:PhoG like DNA-binding family protein [Aspergillus affinis]|uniref:PhoG like DNA-binding family protein n=1 Tax=Aspergillus affinis TaxID=1070780 RepID=UPI0022FE0824|nr:PhoG like DNA-binding family protein [Aspergillus affinis]KAI9042108.1 PhoG like DNA-binding family protein [Aspergillus affinis]
MSRIAPYTMTTGLEGYMDHSSSINFQHGSVLMDPVQRLQPSMADAPPFHDTSILRPIMAGGQTIKPEIQAKIHKGFFQINENWTCYRRNYISISCSFSLQPWTHGPMFLTFPDSTTQRIIAFSMSISAIVNGQYSEIRELVQHMPKRDKQSERKPAKVVLQPSQPPPLIPVPGSSPNNSDHGFFLGSSAARMGLEYSGSYTGATQPSQPPTQHTFERIQFQKATANKGKRRGQQPYYSLVVELYAAVENPVSGADTLWVKIARRLSDPVVVRGR